MTIERGLSVFFLVVSIAYLYAATGFSFGSLASPRAGFLPQIVGGLAVLLTFIDFIGTARRAPGEQERSRLVIAAGFVGVMALYVVALPLVGFPVSTTLCTFALLKVGGTRGYIVPAIISVCLSGGVWLAFQQLLNLQLP